MKAIIAAAGTGGHINPAIAIANKIKEKEPNSEIIFIGTTRGLENNLVPRAGYSLKTIDAYGLSAKLTPSQIKKMIKTIKGIGEAKEIIQKFKPDLVIGTGGYICGPVVMAAKKCNVPVILHESNAFPGKAVKMLAKKANTVLISFEEAREKIKKANKIVYTGTPIHIHKQNYTKNKKIDIIKKLGLQEDKPIVLIFGGSQGAKKINESVVDLLNKKLNRNYQIMWATGPKQYDIIKEELEKQGKNINNMANAKILPYIYNMEEVMNVCDVIVARSGAMTIAEIAAIGKPSILIPLPNVSQNHQLYNAKVLESVGAANIILNEKITSENLNQTIGSILLDNNKIDQMGKKALTKASKDVEENIYKEIKKIIK